MSEAHGLGHVDGHGSRGAQGIGVARRGDHLDAEAIETQADGAEDVEVRLAAVAPAGAQRPANQATVIRLVAALLAEQRDEWRVSKRYLSSESMALLKPPAVPALENKEAE